MQNKKESNSNVIGMFEEDVEAGTPQVAAQAETKSPIIEEEPNTSSKPQNSTFLQRRMLLDDLDTESKLTTEKTCNLDSSDNADDVVVFKKKKY